jgi:hypothetical protein
MGWWDTFTKGVTDYITTGSTGNTFADFATRTGLGYALSKTSAGDSFKAGIPAVGYQGGIPNYNAVQERLPLDDSNRTPGEAGRRYFSDMVYSPSNASNNDNNNNNNNNNNDNNNTGEDTPNTNEQPPYDNEGGGATMEMAAGGIASVNQGYYLGGQTDGMADKVPARIDGNQEARLSDGEFVIPADVVSHLGNGNSDAGSQQLHGMMDSVRKARTGNPEQGKEIDPNKFMPTMARGGIASYNRGGNVPSQYKYSTHGDVDTTSPDPGAVDSEYMTNKPTQTGTESSLSSWAGPYVTDMLGKGQALSNKGYDAYTGPLSAGTNALQDQAFTGIGGLSAPTGMGAYTPQTFGAEQATAGMNPYLMASLNPQLDEARRQSEIDRVANAGRMTKAGSFGGSRQALMDMENTRNLQSNLANITGQGYATAYDKAREQFNTEQGRGMEAQNMANQYGFDVLGGQATAGATQRGIEAEGIAADKAQFDEERLFPYKQVQYMQSLLQDLPLEAQSISYAQPSDYAKNMGAVGSIEAMLRQLYGSGDDDDNDEGEGGTYQGPTA